MKRPSARKYQKLVDAAGDQVNLAWSYLGDGAVASAARTLRNAADTLDLAAALRARAFKAAGIVMPSCSPEVQLLRATLRAIADSKLTGVDFGDWVKAACEDALAGVWPECPHCGTAVHDGACVGEVG